jgi:hypothetical protein
MQAKSQEKRQESFNASMNFSMSQETTHPVYECHGGIRYAEDSLPRRDYL